MKICYTFDFAIKAGMMEFSKVWGLWGEKKPFLSVYFISWYDWVGSSVPSLRKKYCIACCLVRQGGNSLNFKMILQRKVEMYLRNDKNVNSVCLSFSYSSVESGTQARHLFLFDFFIIFYSLPLTFLKFIQSFSISSSALPLQNADSAVFVSFL